MSKNCLNESIAKLKELTAKLPSFPVPVEILNFGPLGNKWEKGNPGFGEVVPLLDATNAGYKEYKMKEGECFAWFIHRSGNDVAVHRWFNSRGTKFPEHSHAEKELKVIYQGTMQLTRNGKTEVLKKGDFVYIEPNSVHSSTFPEDCKYITITIPPAKEFPNVTG